MNAKKHMAKIKELLDKDGSGHAEAYYADLSEHEKQEIKSEVERTLGEITEVWQTFVEQVRLEVDVALDFGARVSENGRL